MVLLVFIDGIGLGPLGAQNPFDGAPLEVLAPLAHRPAPHGLACTFVDASLGHPGLPQSATGQAVIFTGEDAIAEAGGHWSGAPTPRIQRFIAKHSVFKKVESSAFLNAYDRRRAEHLKRVMSGDERPMRRHPPSATSWAALANGSPRTFEDVLAGRAATFDFTGEVLHAQEASLRCGESCAATFDFTGEVLRAFGVRAPSLSIPQAARNVLCGAREVKLAAFETFLTDKAGHEQDMTWARTEIVRVDRFLSNLILQADRDRDLLVITSDHGNLEDLSTRGHTTARVPLFAYGRNADTFTRGARSLLDIAPRLLAAANTG